MDSQHRHDLKENDLEQFLLHFKDFWNKHGMTVLVAILVVVVAITGYRYFTNQAAQSHERAWADLAGASSPEALRNVGLTTEDPAVRAQAFLRAGTMELEQAVTLQPRPASPDAPAPQAPTPQERTESLERAEQDFRRVLEQQAVPPVYHVNATMGLANVAESRRNWDSAREQWKQVKDLAGERYLAMAVHAEQRLEYLSRLKDPVYFAPEAPKQDFQLPPLDLTRPQDATPADTPTPPDGATPPDAPAPAPAPDADTPDAPKPQPSPTEDQPSPAPPNDPAPADTPEPAPAEPDQPAPKPDEPAPDAPAAEDPKPADTPGSDAPADAPSDAPAPSEPADAPK